MYPILLQIGPITIFSLWIFITFGFFTALLLMLQLVKKSRLKMQFLADYSLAIFFAGIIMARIFFAVRNYEFYFMPFNLQSIIQIFYIWDKGLSLWGGVLGALFALAWFAWKNGENILRWLDVFTVSILGAFVFGNIGAFLDGINYGNETALPWGVVIENSIFAVPIHPVQIYAAIYCLILTAALFFAFFSDIGKKEGNIAIIGFGSYFFFRFIEEFFRGDEANIFFGVREGQIYALLIFLISGILFYAKNFQAQDKIKPPADKTHDTP